MLALEPINEAVSNIELNTVYSDIWQGQFTKNLSDREKKNVGTGAKMFYRRLTELRA